MDCSNISKRICELRNEEDWSDYKLSKKSGIGVTAMKNIIKGKHIPTIDTLQKICGAFGISLSQFFDSKLFYDKEKDRLYSELWKKLKSDDKERVLIYIHGLLRKEIKNEDFKDEL